MTDRSLPSKSSPQKGEANTFGFATRAIHAGQTPDPSTGAVMQPIYATSTFKQRSPGEHTGYEYARTQNPTRMAFERCIADLEGGAHGFAFSSGLGAMGTVLELLDAGSHLVAVDDLYGGSWRLFERVRRRTAGLRVSYVDPNRPGQPRAGDHARHPDDLGRDAQQSAAQDHRPRPSRAIGQGARDSHRVRQHLRFALSAAAARAGLRHRSALGDQVHQRSFRCGGRRRADRKQHPAEGAARVHAERDRLDHGPVHRLPRPARREDAAAAHGAALRQRPEDRALAGRPSQDRTGALPRAAQAPAARAGSTPDAGLRRDDLGLPQSRPGRHPALSRALPSVHARREPGRGGEPGRPSGPDEPCLIAPGAARRAQAHGQPGAAIGGHRGRG